MGALKNSETPFLPGVALVESCKASEGCDAFAGDETLADCSKLFPLFAAFENIDPRFGGRTLFTGFACRASIAVSPSTRGWWTFVCKIVIYRTASIKRPERSMFMGPQERPQLWDDGQMWEAATISITFGGSSIFIQYFKQKSKEWTTTLRSSGESL